jgi:hypothetical protein
MSRPRLARPDSDAEYKEGLKEWKKCFSRTRKLDYYFNERTKESLWTLEEVKERIKSSNQSSISSSHSEKPTVSNKEEKKETKKIQKIQAPQDGVKPKKAETSTKTYKL